MNSCARVRAAVLAAGLVCVSTSQGASIDLKFARVEPSNAPWNPASQFNARVSDVAGNPGQVVFRMTNNVAGIYCSITEIYFDSHGSSPLSTLLSPVSNSAGTTFVGGGASPGNLPGGNALANAFTATSAFSADSGNGGPVKGIDSASDWVDMTFNLASGKTFADVVAALNASDLRLGLHVKAIIGGPVDGGDFSDSFVNTITAVPLPAAAWSGLGVLSGIVVLQWRRQHRRV